MGSQDCAACGRVDTHAVELVKRNTGDGMRLCPGCLDSMMRLQAPLGDDAVSEAFIERAQDEGFEAWQSDYVLYLLPGDVGHVVTMAR